MGKEKESRGFFDLKKQFIFYASYHNDSVSLELFVRNQNSTDVTVILEISKKLILHQKIQTGNILR